MGVPFLKITTDLYQIEVLSPGVLQGPSDSLTRPHSYCQSLGMCSPHLHHVEPSHCPQSSGSFSHTPKPFFVHVVPFTAKAFPSPLFLGNLLPLFMTRLKCSFLGASYSHMSSFTWWTNSCGGSQATGVNDAAANSEDSTWTHNERSFGNQKALPRKQSRSPQ